MTVLSYSNEHDAGAAIVRDGVIVSAINEERLTRLKKQDGFPALSLQYVLEAAGIGPDEVDHVVLPEIHKVRDLLGRVTRFPFLNLSLDGLEPARCGALASSTISVMPPLPSMPVGSTRPSSSRPITGATSCAAWCRSARAST